MLQNAGGGWKNHVRGDGGDDDHVQVRRFDAGHVKCPAGGSTRHIGGLFIVSRDASFTDSGPGNNPFIRGFNHFFQVMVGSDGLR